MSTDGLFQGSLIQLATAEGQEEVDISEFEAEWDPVAESRSAIIWDACANIADEIEACNFILQDQMKQCNACAAGEDSELMKAMKRTQERLDVLREEQRRMESLLKK